MTVRNNLLGNEARGPERRRMDDLDECLDTIFCEGDCQNTIPETCKASTEEWSRGEGEDTAERGVVNHIVNNLEKSKAKQKVSTKFVKPYGKRGVRRDGLIQSRIDSFESKGGIMQITGLCGSLGKRKLPLAESDSPGAKIRKFDMNL